MLVSFTIEMNINFTFSRRFQISGPKGKNLIYPRTAFIKQGEQETVTYGIAIDCHMIKYAFYVIE